VPPDENAALDNATLIAILAETRELAHARMARRTDLWTYEGAIPTLIVPASGDTGVSLEKSGV
jgi:hypothetical protein